MKHNRLTILAAATLMGLSSMAQAGTAGLTGVYSGDYQFIAYAHNIPQGTDEHGAIFTATSPANYMGQANARQTWNWDFDAGIASFEAGQHMLTIGVPYTLHNANSIAITDHGDGTYSGDLDFQVFNPAFGNPRSVITITWDITDDGMGNLTMDTFDADGNGFAGTVPGCDHLRDAGCTDSVSWGGFPFPFEPTWDGVAVVPVPAAVWLFGSGLLGLVAVARRKKVEQTV